MKYLFLSVVLCSCVSFSSCKPQEKNAPDEGTTFELISETTPICTNENPTLFEKPVFLDLDESLVDLVPKASQDKAIDFLSGASVKEIGNSEIFSVDERKDITKKYLVRACLSGFFDNHSYKHFESYVEKLNISWYYVENYNVIRSGQFAMIDSGQTKPVAYIIWTEFDIRDASHLAGFVE